jgi:hypothetical protein
VYENSQGEFYVFDTVDDELGGQGQRRRIITQAEKQRLVDPQADATAQGNLSARWAELQQQIAQADAELQEQIRQNRIAEAQERENYDFLVKKQRFAESQDNKRLANETSAQMFNQEQMIANLQMQGLQMQVEQQNLQMQAQMEVDSFNSQMGFSVAQANQQAAAQKREELAQSARDISGFSQSPTDWGRLAAFETAGRVWGDEDQAIREEGGFITDKSLQPLAQGLDNRDRIIATPDNPFSFTPIQAPTFQPFELPQLPTPTIAPVATPEAAPAAAPPLLPPLLPPPQRPRLQRQGGSRTPRASGSARRPASGGCWMWVVWRRWNTVAWLREPTSPVTPRTARRTRRSTSRLAPVRRW